MDATALIFQLALVAAIIYFLLIRPQKKRVDDHRKMTQAVEPGDRIVTIGGLHGTVVSIGDEEVELEAAPGVTLHYAKSAIARRLTENLPSAATKSITARSTADDKSDETEALPVPAAAKKTTAKKSTARKSTAKRTTAKKTPARKTTAKKTTAKKSTSRRS